MRKWKLVLITGIMILGCVGCGAQEAGSTNSSDEVFAVKEQADNEETEAESSDSVQPESAPQESEPTQDQVEEKNDNYADLEEKGENGDIVAFAQEIQTAVSAKDLAALADLCVYPVAVNDEIVEDRDAFMELGEDAIFTEERCDVIASVETSALEETMAGVIMGDATPNIIFKSVDGKLGITGIN